MEEDEKEEKEQEQQNMASQLSPSKGDKKKERGTKVAASPLKDGSALQPTASSRCTSETKSGASIAEDGVFKSPEAKKLSKSSSESMPPPVAKPKKKKTLPSPSSAFKAPSVSSSSAYTGSTTGAKKDKKIKKKKNAFCVPRKTN